MVSGAFSHPVAILAAPGVGGVSVGQLAILVAAVVGLTILMRSTARRVRASKQVSATPPKERYVEYQEASRAVRNMGQVMLELDQLSREVHGRLDTKLVRLETIIRDADERIERLSRLAKAGEDRPSPEITVDEEASQVPGTPGGGAQDRRHTRIFELADSGLTTLEVAKQVGQTPGEIELILSLRGARHATDGGVSPLDAVSTGTPS